MQVVVEATSAPDPAVTLVVHGGGHIAIALVEVDAGLTHGGGHAGWGPELEPARLSRQGGGQATIIGHGALGGHGGGVGHGGAGHVEVSEQGAGHGGDPGAEFE